MSTPVVVVMPVQPPALRIGDQIRLADNVVVRVTGVTHINKHPIQLYRFAFDEVGGVSSITVPASTVLPLVVPPPAPAAPLKRYLIGGTIHTRTYWSDAVDARDEREAREAALARVKEDTSDFHKFVIETVMETTP